MRLAVADHGRIGCPIEPVRGERAKVRALILESATPAKVGRVLPIEDGCGVLLPDDLEEGDVLFFQRGARSTKARVLAFEPSLIEVETDDEAAAAKTAQQAKDQAAANAAVASAETTGGGAGKEG